MTISYLHADPKVIADFEDPKLPGWVATGEAFQNGAYQKDLNLPDRRLHDTIEGNYAINSGSKGDHQTGTLTSPPFTIDRDFLSFLIAGGESHNNRLEILIDGVVIAKCCGFRNYRLKPNYFDLKKWIGKDARIRLVDESSEPWGRILVDHFSLSNIKPEYTNWNQHKRKFTVSKNHLVFPIRNLTREQRTQFAKSKDWLEISGSIVQIQVEEKIVREYSVLLADSAQDADWYASLNIEEFIGKEATVHCWRSTTKGFDAVHETNSVPGEAQFYKEAYRPQFHFTQKTGFNNDPNGMVYNKGLWHYFWQHNPMKKDMGNQTWGYATSPDLLHWTQHKGALFPNTNGDGRMYSGGGTVDKLNTAGFGKDAMILFFTNTNVGECIAYSTDNGRSFQRYEGNPVITFDRNDNSGKAFHLGRDPKVIWYGYDNDDTPLNSKAAEIGGHWVMLVYDFTKGKENEGGAFYTSINLKDWTRQSLIKGFFECMEIFELPVDGNPDNSRWVIYGGDAKYAIGKFDGRSFTREHEGKHQLHYGSYYASQTFDNSPDGRRIQMGWVTLDAAPDAPYARHHSFPHSLTLHKSTQGVRMHANPIEEIKRLRINSKVIENISINSTQPLKIANDSDTFEITVEFEPGDADDVQLHIAGTHIHYKPKQQKLLNRNVPIKIIDEKVKIRVLVDRCLYEVIGNDGQAYMTFGRDYKIPISEITLSANGTTSKLIKLELHNLKSIWYP